MIRKLTFSSFISLLHIVENNLIFIFMNLEFLLQNQSNCLRGKKSSFWTRLIIVAGSPFSNFFFQSHFYESGLALLFFNINHDDNLLLLFKLNMCFFFFDFYAAAWCERREATIYYVYVVVSTISSQLFISLLEHKI